MKELSIEEKAKAYDEALKQIKECTPDENGFITIYPQEIFPELKEESEDEQIRKALITTVIHASTVYGATREEVLAWLEKQNSLMKCLQIANARIGELIEENYYLKEKQSEQKPADKVEPKYNVGDWLVHNERKHIVKVVNRTPFFYKVVNILGYHYTIINDAIENNYHLWTIKDAKDGDVLTVDNIIFIYKRILASHIVSYCKLINDVFESTVDVRTCCEGNAYVHPATKEQRDLLFQKMKDAGYEWDAEKKELKKIEQKPTWSEEDEKMFESTIKHLKESTYSAFRPYLKKDVDWLKSLKDRYTWKPNNEQMYILNWVANILLNHDGVVEEEASKKLQSLYNDLKKLKE